MKDFDFVLSEVPDPADTILVDPRFVSITDVGKVYRIIIRSVELYSSFIEYQNRYKKYPSPDWFKSEALFELIYCQPSFFDEDNIYE